MTDTAATLLDLNTMAAVSRNITITGAITTVFTMLLPVEMRKNTSSMTIRVQAGIRRGLDPIFAAMVSMTVLNVSFRYNIGK